MNTDDIRLLIEADRRKDQFLSMLVHELRNPLAALAAAAEFLQMGDLDPAQRQRIDGVVVRQVRQLCRLADDLLDVARILRDKFELHIEPVDLRTVLMQAVESTRPLFEARGQQLRVDVPERPLPLRADRARLVQVFVNLLSNAAKFSRDGGKITIAADRAARSSLDVADDLSPEQVVVRVRDDGVGMTAELVPQVFDLFVQAAAPGRPPEGLGVGLTLVRRLVRLHGGSVWASSEGPGLGSEFCVRLPLAWSQLMPTTGLGGSPDIIKDSM